MKKPNIIFILIDDMGWKDTSCYGSEFYETPTIDRLAKDGMRFTDAYAACPVCSPTRASIMSGKYPATVGVTDYIGGHARAKLIDAPYIDHLPLEEISIARALKKGGYKTWHVGKWHLGKEPYYPEKHSFDVNIGGSHIGAAHYFSPYNIPMLPNGPDGEYLTDRLTDESIKLIKNNDGTPFFLNLCHYAVHATVEVKEEWTGKYKEKAKRLGLDKLKTFEQGDFIPPEHMKNERILRRLVQSDPEYAAMIENLDWNIGRLLAALKETGQFDNTVVFFTSDNGGLSTAEGSPTCNAPLSEGKGWVYEGGVREPLIVRWPGVIKPDSICHTPVTSPDFYPTFLQIAGLDLMPGQHRDGKSILPLLKQTGKLERENIFWHYPHYADQGGTPGSSIRAGDWKLIEFFEDGRLELYNLRDDIGENNNLAGEKPELAKSLRAKLAEWRESVEAKIPQINPDYKPRQTGTRADGFQFSANA